MPDGDSRRQVPRTDVLLSDPRLVSSRGRLGPKLVKQAVIAAQDQVRQGALAAADAVEAVLAALPATASMQTPVLNATGVVLHTNLGRASLSDAAVEAVVSAAGYVDVEYDRATGRRARRGRSALAALARAMPEAEDVLVVNNGAAALLLATTALASGREVIVSRGELVEIGDGFRLPALIESAGARIREVGATNRTTVADYSEAIGSQTGCLLKVHPSNFIMTGFTAAVAVQDLARLGPPIVADLGSGLLRRNELLPDEPDVRAALVAGADLVTCSGDKLLGGPQAGLIFGRTEVVQRLRRHPMARALRVDKLTLAALEATVAWPPTPTERYLHADVDVLRRRCEWLAAAVGGEVVASDGAVGGGGAPGVPLRGWAVALDEAYAEPLRSGNPCVVGRIEQGRLLLDLRCVPEQDDVALTQAATRAVAAAPGGG
jgi:L-seryl-tRNA(Ser) seleniumtransferase